MPADRPYTPAELNAVAKALFDFNAGGVEYHNDNWTSADFAPEAKLVLEAAAPLIAARVRAQVAEEIAQAIEAADLPPGSLRNRQRGCALIARAHATTEEDPNADPA